MIGSRHFPIHPVFITSAQPPEPYNFLLKSSNKMLLRLSAGAFRNASSAGVARSSRVIHGVRSGSVPNFLFIFGTIHSNIIKCSGPFCLVKRLSVEYSGCTLLFANFCINIDSNFFAVLLDVSCYTCIGLSFHSGHNRLVYPSLWRASLHRRSTCKSSQ